MQPHVTVIHRTRGAVVPYLDHLDHDSVAVSYVCSQAARHRIPEREAAAVHILEDMTGVSASVRAMAARFGTPQRIVTVSEFDLLTAAELRAEFDLPGDRPERVRVFRDKLAMYSAAATGGVPTPAFGDAPDTAAITRFAQLHGFPLIVKPRFGSGSRDVVKLHSAADLTALPDLAAEPFLVQRFCPDQVGIVDGVWTGTELGPWRVSQCLDTCLDFATSGASLGIVEIDDPTVVAAVPDFAYSVLTALSDGAPQVFHLEFFLGTASGVPQMQLLEVAARPGGAEVTHLWREVHGYDLVGAALDIQLGRSPGAHLFARGSVTGQLLIKPAVTPPCRILATHYDVPPTHAPYHRSIPEEGSVITETDGYVDIGATFRFRGESTAAVTEAMQYTAASFSMDCVPCVASIAAD